MSKQPSLLTLVRRRRQRVQRLLKPSPKPTRRHASTH